MTVLQGNTSVHLFCCQREWCFHDNFLLLYLIKMKLDSSLNCWYQPGAAFRLLCYKGLTQIAPKPRDLYTVAQSWGLQGAGLDTLGLALAWITSVLSHSGLQSGSPLHVLVSSENTGWLCCAVSLVLNDFCKVLILNCFFVGAGEKEDKTSADKTTEVCSETTTAERRGKYLYQTAPRKYAEH